MLSRREFLKSTTCSLSIFFTCGCFNKTSTDKLNREKKNDRSPNIIFILTDDQRWDSLGCINPILKTPNIDDLVSKGVMFSNTRVTSSICGPSRASIMTGQYARRTGIHGFNKQLTPDQLANTYPMLMKKNGYRIGFVGKYGIGAENLPNYEYDYWAGWSGWGRYQGHTNEEGKPIHLTRKLGNDSLEFLDSCNQEQPFCLSVSFKAPHCQDGDPRQFITDPFYDDIYKDTEFSPPKKANRKYWENLPDFLKKNNEARKRWKIRFSSPQLYQKMVRKYHTLIYGIDIEIGRIRNKLEQINAADNTIIIYTSDNGFYLGEHGLAGKWYPHEESIRIPLIIYDPRFKNTQGTIRQQMALNIDLAPTILDFASITAPKKIQGRSLLPIIRDKKKNLRKDFFYEHLLDHEGIPKTEGIIGKRYKYTRWITQQPVYETLWDLKVDPDETINFATHPEYKDVLITMRNRFFHLAQKVK